MWNIFKRSNPYLENPNYDLGVGIEYAEAIVDNRTTGIRVDADSVMSHPMVRGGVQLISNLASTLPINVMLDGGEKGRQVDYSHHWHRRLNSRPTGCAPRSVFIQTLLREAIIYGNAYYLILPDRLLWLDPRLTTVETNGLDVIYETQINGAEKRFDQSQVVHIRNLSKDGGYTGEPLYEALMEPLCAALAKYTHIRRHFENGTFSNLVWTLPAHVKSPEKAKEFEANANAKYSGIGNAFRNIFLANGGDVKPLASNNNEAQAKELMEFDIIVIANALSLPPDALGAAQNTSYSAQEVGDLKYLRSVNHWLIQIEQELSDKLLTTDEVATGQRWIEFQRKATVEMDPVTENAIIEKQYTLGLISKQYARRKLNAPILDVEGEDYYRTQNMIPDVEVEVEQEPEPQQEQEPAEEEEQRTDPRLTQMVEANLRRLVERVAKQNKPAREHREVWLEAFGMFANAEDVLTQLGNLIDGATDSRSAIAKNIDLAGWTKQLTDGVDTV